MKIHTFSSIAGLVQEYILQQCRIHVSLKASSKTSLHRKDSSSKFVKAGNFMKRLGFLLQLIFSPVLHSVRTGVANLILFVEFHWRALSHIGVALLLEV